MGAGHTHALYAHRAGPLHHLAPEVKIAAMIAFTIIVVATPRDEFAAFAGYAILLALVATAGRVKPLWLAKRAMIELPFVIFALVLPFAGHGERVTWLGMSLSVDGIYGAWNIAVKGTLGVLASLLLAATTSMRALLDGLDRLHCPGIIIQIATFMLRYLDVLAEEARRMRIARLSRGYDPRFLWQLKAFAIGVGALFLRAFERGERVYLAMIARGYTGRLPDPDRPPTPRRDWLTATALPAVAGTIALSAVLT